MNKPALYANYFTSTTTTLVQNAVATKIVNAIIIQSCNLCFSTTSMAAAQVIKSKWFKKV